MKNLFFWDCVFHILGALSALGSVVISILQGSSYTWQLIAFFWIFTSFIKTLTLRKHENK